MAKLKMFVCSQSDYLEPFAHLFDEVLDIKKADVVMFTGGSDVSPYLYGEPCGKYTSTNKRRDENEVQYANYAIAKKLPMLGICRGSQFLTVMAGGTLVQDVTNHCQWHAIITNKGEVMIMSSTHHQMMNPYTLDKNKYEVIAYARHRSKHYWNGWNAEIPQCGIVHPDGFNPEKEPEIVYYPEIKALCIQGHPEIMDPDSEGVAYCQVLVKEYLCV